MLRFPTSATRSSDSSESCLSFSDRFFSLSNGVAEDFSDLRITTLLKGLEEAGYTIDEEKVVYGLKSGVYWPCLKTKGRFSINVGIATGARGASGMGTKALLQYLQEKKSEAETYASSQTLSRAAVPVLQQSPISNSSSVSSGHDSNTASSNVRMVTPTSILDMFPGRVVNIVGGSSESLEDLRRFGAFQGVPPVAVNSFTAEQLFNAELSIFEGAKYLIIKKGVILACSEGIEILPQTSFANMIFYTDKSGNSSDNPCKDSPKLKTTLGDMEKLKKILPYLNGIPMYRR